MPLGGGGGGGGVDAPADSAAAGLGGADAEPGAAVWGDWGGERGVRDAEADAADEYRSRAGSERTADGGWLGAEGGTDEDDGPAPSGCEPTAGCRWRRASDGEGDEGDEGDESKRGDSRRGGWRGWKSESESESEVGAESTVSSGSGEGQGWVSTGAGSMRASSKKGGGTAGQRR